MSNIEPTKPYIYQPEPVYAKDGTENVQRFGVAGPGAEGYFGKRFTREEAEELLKTLEKASP
jgi:formylmethanofuran dehydrogenase subunit E-like metal-binding protein